MKFKIFLFILFCYVAVESIAKNTEPVKWSGAIVYLPNKEADIEFTATIDSGFHIFSAYPTSDPKVFAAPTEIKLINDLSNYQLIGSISEGAYIVRYNNVWPGDEHLFEGKAVFKQRIKILGHENFSIFGKINLQACDANSCFPSRNLKFQVPVVLNSTMGRHQIDSLMISNKVLQDDGSVSKFRYWLSAIRRDKDQLITRASGVTNIRLMNNLAVENLWQLFLLGFLGGLIALLTPCVFPMVPLTVSFFTGRNNSRRNGIVQALIYGGFILLIYLLFSVPFHFLDQINENILNDISTNVYLNVVFFVIIILFALSFFGLFEITLPAGLANKMDRNAEAGGFIGSFFMALTLAIVSFSCTGPILGSLLAGSLAQDGGAMQLTLGMGGFGLGLGVPFTIFALFPGLLKSLPKSGGWLNSVKVVLGFLELALALKFLSQADLVIHWNILKYEVFLGAWVVIFIGMFLYLIGLIKFSNEKPIEKFSKFRVLLTAAVGAWIIYLASGFMTNEMGNSYRSLNLLSGLLPPTGYSYAYESTSPPGLTCEHDFNIALERGRRENKPLLVDFTGKACVNCRKMEEQVWPKVQGLLQSEFVIVSLFVDDKEELPEDLKEVYRTKWSGVEKEIETYGDMWSAFEIETFNSNSQPLYVIIDPMTNAEEELMNEPLAGMVSEEEFRNWLEEGIRLYGLK